MAEILDIVVRQRGARTVARDIAKISVAADSAAASVNRLGVSTTRAGAAAGASARQFGGAAAATTALGAASARTTQTLGQFASAATIAGGALAVGFGIPILNAVQAAGDFEASLLRVQNVAQATPAEIDAVRQSAEQLGVSTAFSAQQAAEGFVFLSRAGLEVETQLGAIGPSLNLAAAGQIELAEAANIVTNVLAGLGQGVDDLDKTVDVLTKTAQSSNTTISGLGQSFSFVAPAAAALNQDVEDVATALGALGNAGIPATRAGRNLAVALGSLSNQTPAAAQALQDLSVNVFDAEGNFRSIIDIVDDLRDATAGLTDEVRSQRLGDIFTEQGGRAVQALINQGDRVEKLQSQIQDFEGSAQRAADTLLSGFNGALVALTSATEGLGISIGDTLLRPLEFLVRGLTSIVRTLAALPQPIQAAIAGFFSLAAALGAVALAVGVLSFGASAAGFASIGAAAAAAAGGVAALATSFGALLVAALPIVAPIAAVAGAFFLLKDAEFQVGQSTVTLSAILEESLSRANDFVSEFADQATLSFNLLKDDIAELIEETELIPDAFSDALGSINFNTFIGGLQASFVGGGRIIGEFLRTTGVALGGFGSDLVDFFGNIPAALRAAVSGDFAQAGEILADSFQNGFAAQFDGFGERAAEILTEEALRAQQGLDILGNTAFIQGAAGRVGGGAGGTGETPVAGGAGAGAGAPGAPGGAAALTAAEIAARQSALDGLRETLLEMTSAEQQLAQATDILTKAVDANLISAEAAETLYTQLGEQVFTDLRNSLDPVSALLDAQAEQLRAITVAGAAAGISLEEIARLQGLVSEKTQEALFNTREFTDQLSLTESFTAGAREGFRDFTDSLGNDFSIISSGFQQTFQLATDTLTEFLTTGKLDFASFGIGVLQIIQQVVIQLLILKAVQAAVGAFGGGGAGGAVGGIAGAFAEGGSVRANEPIIVGEEGPEVFTPPRGGTIVPNDALGGGGNAAPEVNVSVVNVSDPSEITNAMSSREGTEVIMNTLARNRGRLKALSS